MNVKNIEYNNQITEKKIKQFLVKKEKVDIVKNTAS